MPRVTCFIAALAACTGLLCASQAWAQAGSTTFQPGSNVGGNYPIHLNMFRGDCPPSLDYSQFPMEIVQQDARTLRLKVSGEYGTATWDPDNRTFDGEVPAFAEIGSDARPVRINGSVIDRNGERSVTLLFRWRGRDCTATGNSEYSPIVQSDSEAGTEATDGSSTFPPATVIGPADQPDQTPQSNPTTTPESDAGRGLGKWAIRLLILAAAGIFGWLAGSALRKRRNAPKGATRPVQAPASQARTAQTKPLSAWETAVLPLRKFADFTGRAPRREYWLFALLVFGASILTGIIQGALGLEGWYGLGPLRVLLIFAILLPGIAVAVRRLHDTDRSGVTLLIGLVPIIGGLILLIFFVQPGTEGQNSYGPAP